MSGSSQEQPLARGQARLNVMVVDDSAVVRLALSKILEQDGRFEVVTAADPLIAARKMAAAPPDVMVLDLEMPKMDGLTFLKKLMSEPQPVPVIVCSGHTGPGTRMAITALELGAVEVIGKPQLGVQGFLDESSRMLIDAVLATARSRPKKRVMNAVSTLREAVATARGSSGAHSPRLIAIGASTGGTEAIRRVLEQLPADCPPIAIVQHIPGAFSAAFADHLNELCRMEVKEARDGDRLRRGLALVAPGEEHMRVIARGDQLKVRLDRSAPVSRHRPSVDVLFESVAQTGLAGATGVLLTGMGEDGAAGMLAMRNAGMRTIAQDEASSVVYGMPKEAAARGAVERVLPLGAIARELMEPRRSKA